MSIKKSGITFKPGDIVLIHRKKYNGPFKYLVTRLILFFTTEWWKGEKTSNHYHAEMVVEDLGNGEIMVVTMEPPKCRFKTRSLNRKAIFRVRLRLPMFNKAFFRYVDLKLGQKYDFLKLLFCWLDWVFHTTWFTRNYVNPCRDICSEFVARFYEEVIRIPCSYLTADSTKPDDIYDYCRESSSFITVYDERP